MWDACGMPGKSLKVSLPLAGCAKVVRCIVQVRAVWDLEQKGTTRSCFYPSCPRCCDLQAMQKLQNTKKLQDLAGGAGLDSLLKK